MCAVGFLFGCSALFEGGWGLGGGGTITCPTVHFSPVTV